MKKQSIVLVHGMWSRGVLFSGFKNFFQEKGYECIEPDLPMHTKEKSINMQVGNLGFLDFTEHIAKIIQKMENPPVVMGHSMGGLIALKLAEMGLAKKAVLITPATQRGIMNIGIKPIFGFLPAFTTPFFWKKPLLPSKKGLNFIFGEVPQSLKESMFNFLVPESGRALFEIALWPLDLKKSTYIDNTKINCPVLQIAGKKDNIIPYPVLKKQADILSDNLKDFKFKAYENKGHGILWEQDWDKVANDINIWLEAV